MNRKQKKAKQLRARAHTKNQATVYLTQKEKQDIADWNSYDEAELLAVEQDSQSFINKVKTAFYLISFFLIAYLVWCNW
ncbi:hypothetical protein [Acinetobacter venetianus]|uniref:hypothetical protein n=1 Tax=Acinetobacter venetianus TaxID=52133 RepID=UPI00214FC6BE|nr:hypothetical protein [Acinetobacter venetianus]MCR4530020.1 hypothetical protein [Acinetobacter venetianus]